MITAALLTITVGVASPPANDRAVAICKVEAVLQAIHTVPWRPPPNNNRFVILHSISNNGQRFVQCLFEKRDRRMICEASSGYFDFYSLHMAPTRWVAIGHAGFSGDGTKGNFQQFVATPSANYRRVATLMVDTLRMGYGIKANDMGIKAGLVDVGIVSAACEQPGRDVQLTRFEP